MDAWHWLMPHSLEDTAADRVLIYYPCPIAFLVAAFQLMAFLVHS